MTEHYFSESPTAPYARRDIRVSLGGSEHSLITAGGVFSPEHLDRGTEVLLSTLEQRGPREPNHPILDLGCGWGPIALDAGLREPQREVWAVDVNERSLELTRENAERLGLRRVLAHSPEEVPGELHFGEIRSNPPIRIGKPALHAMLNQWLPRLVPGGSATLVVAKHLGAPSLERWLTETFPWADVNRLARDRGFHVIDVSRPAT